MGSATAATAAVPVGLAVFMATDLRVLALGTASWQTVVAILGTWFMIEVLGPHLSEGKPSPNYRAKKQPHRAYGMSTYPPLPHCLVG